MKITKAEIIWLIVVVVLYVLYNIPGFPAYGDARMCIIDGIVLVGGIWVCIYVGMSKVYKVQSLREEEEEDN